MPPAKQSIRSCNSPGTVGDMSGEKEGEGKPAPKPDDPGGLALAVALTALAGSVDAVAFLHWRGLFVSFMSGNSTMLGVEAAGGEGASALLSAAVIAAFVAGVAAGELVASAAGRWAAGVVLLLVAVLLAAAAAAVHAGLHELLTAPALSLAMGVQNAAVHRAGGVGVALTYVTGTLVHVGRSVAEAIRGMAPWSAAGPYAMLWAGLAGGSAAGALVTSVSETLALAVAAGMSAVLAAVVAAAAPERKGTASFR